MVRSRTPRTSTSMVAPAWGATVFTATGTPSAVTVTWVRVSGSALSDIRNVPVIRWRPEPTPTEYRWEPFEQLLGPSSTAAAPATGTSPDVPERVAGAGLSSDCRGTTAALEDPPVAPVVVDLAVTDGEVALGARDGCGTGAPGPSADSVDPVAARSGAAAVPPVRPPSVVWIA